MLGRSGNCESHGIAVILVRPKNNLDSCVFIGRGWLVVGNRRVVNRTNRDGEIRRRRIDGPIVGYKGDRIGTVVICFRRVSELWRRPLEGAVSGPGNDAKG